MVFTLNMTQKRPFQRYPKHNRVNASNGTQNSSKPDDLDQH